MYSNVIFNVFFFLNKKVHLLVSELYIYRNAQCNNKKKNTHGCFYRHRSLLNYWQTEVCYGICLMCAVHMVLWSDVIFTEQ